METLKKFTTTHFENVDENKSDYYDEDDKLEESFEMEINEEFELKFEFNSVIHLVFQYCKILNKSNFVDFGGLCCLKY